MKYKEDGSSIFFKMAWQNQILEFHIPSLQIQRNGVLYHEIGHFVCAKYLRRQAFIQIDAAGANYRATYNTNGDSEEEAVIVAAGIEAERLCGRIIEDREKGKYASDVKALDRLLEKIPGDKMVNARKAKLSSRIILEKTMGREMIERAAGQMLEMVGLSVNFFVGYDDYDFMRSAEDYQKNNLKRVHMLSPVDFPFMLRFDKY